MGDLVREDPRQLPLVARGQDQAAVHVQVPAGKREGVDLLRVHDLHLVRELRPPRLVREPLDDRVHVARGLRVAQDPHLALDLRGGLPAGLHVLLDGEEVDRGGGRGRQHAQREHGHPGTADRESLEHGACPPIKNGCDGTCQSKRGADRAERRPDS